MVEEDRTDQYTDIQLQFLDLVRKYPVKTPETVVDYITSQGGTVLEEPELLAQALSECEITPVRRRQILKHWFADKGVEVSPELIKKVTLPPEQRKKIEEEEETKRERERAKYSVDEDTGVIKVATTGEKALTWPEAEKLAKNIKREIGEKGKVKEVTYVYDSDTNTVRMAKGGEIGGTLEQAKELKRMASEEGKSKETGESPFITDADGNWTLNPRARVTGIELMALESIRRAQDRGEPVDPIEVLGRAAEKMQIYREALGGGARQSPDWMTDPGKFIEMVQTISGGNKGDETLKTELAELKKSLDDMREQRYREQAELQQRQIGILTDKVGELTDLVIDLKRPVTGRTEMDLLHEIADKGLEVIKTELPGFRRDIKEAVIGGALPPPKTVGERADRTAQLRQAVKKDREIEEIGRRIFFGEGREPEETVVPPPPQPGSELSNKHKALMDEKFPLGTPAPLPPAKEPPRAWYPNDTPPSGEPTVFE